jgi:predicted DCC family thiol-disulfide oxidoreductase YuxK
VTIVPNQKPGAPQAYHLTLADCQSSAWAIDGQGTAWSGAGAIAAAMDAGLGVRAFKAVYRLPVLGALADLGYRVVARVRHHLPGTTPYCQRFPEVCGGESS